MVPVIKKSSTNILYSYAQQYDVSEHVNKYETQHTDEADA